MRLGNPTCPKCRSTMVLRTARQGRYRGKQFWGCSRFPKCKGIRAIDGADGTSPERSGGAWRKSPRHSSRQETSPIMSPSPPTPPASPSSSPRLRPSPERLELVKQATDRWRSQLMDTGGRNRLKSPLRHHLPLGAAGCRLLPLPAAGCHERSGVSDECVSFDGLFGFRRLPW